MSRLIKSLKHIPWLIIAAIVALCGFYYQTRVLYHPNSSNNATVNVDCNWENFDASLPGKALTSIPLTCFFSANYFNARKLFLKSAGRANAEMRSLNVMENLTTDVAIFKGHPERFLIHISGTHGTEGYAGSAIQSAILTHLSAKSFEDRSHLPTIILVHALNPFGFANNRRVNEDNIDLNRNFLNDSDWSFVTNRDPNFAGYVDADYLINPQSMPFSTGIFKDVLKSTLLNDIYSLGRTIFSAVKFGPQKLKKALVSGNYFQARGLSYGGTALSKSAKNLISLVRDQLKIHEIASKVVLIDVHTGLGPSGVDTLAAMHTNSAATVEKMFPIEVSVDYSTRVPKISLIGGMKDSMTAGNANSALSGYELTVGVITGDFCHKFLAPNLTGDDLICVTQEFGTVDMMLVGTTLVDENYANFYGTDEEKVIYGNRLRSSFYVQTKEWKEAVVKRGVAVFFQSLESF